MNRLNIFLVSIFLFSCSKVATPQEEPKPFTSCEQMLDVSGLKLYQFEVHTGSSKELQIPEDFLRGMTTTELFYQISGFKNIATVIGHAYEKRINFTSYISMFNMFAEFLKRPDAPKVLIQLLQRMDPTIIRWGDNFPKVGSGDCVYFFDCVQIFASHPDIINRMTEGEINLYIHEQIRLYYTIRDMEKIEKGLEFPCHIILGMYGLLNVMFRYEFEPFMQEVEKNPDLKEAMTTGYYYPGSIIRDGSWVIELIGKFQNREK